jgi:hypothetical protein
VSASATWIASIEERGLGLVEPMQTCRHGCDAAVVPGLKMCRRCYGYDLTRQFAEMMLELDRERRS